MSSKREAVSYIRVSSRGQANQDKDGVPRQRAAIAAYAKKLRLQVVEEFSDLGVSGTKSLAERPGLSALLQRVLGSGVRVVLVEKADRLSRDLVEGETILAEFRDRGVRVIEADGGNDLTASDSPTSNMVRQILGSVAEFAKAELVAKMRGARVKIRESGERCEGVRPYGMQEGEAEVLKLIFELNKKDPLTGKRPTTGAIARELNKRGIKTRSGGEWGVDVVRKIIKRGKRPERAPSPA